METKTERQKLNRIKAVLAETGHTGKWLAEQLGKDPSPSSNGAPTPPNPICIHCNILRQFSI